MIQATFKDENRREAMLPPGKRMSFIHTEGDIEHILISVNSAVIHELDKEELKRLAKSASKLRQVTWNIEETEIRPLVQTERGQLDE